MMAILIRLGFSQDVARRVAPFALVALALLLVIAAIAGFEAWRRNDNAAAVKQDRAEGNAEFREKQVTAERQAGADKTKRDSEDRRDLEALEDKVDEADKSGTSAADDVWSGGLWD